MTLADYKAVLTLSYEQFIAQYNVRSSQVHENRSYEKVTDVTRVDLADNQFFFFKNGILKVIYISDDAAAKKIWDEFNTTTNTDNPDNTVRSRAGKTSNQKVFAQQGISVSMSHSDIDFIEIYPPCSLPDYLQHIYQEPGPFIR